MLRYVEFFADVYAQPRTTAPLVPPAGEPKPGFNEIIDIAAAVYDELPESEGYA